MDHNKLYNKFVKEIKKLIQMKDDHSGNNLLKCQRRVNVHLLLNHKERFDYAYYLKLYNVEYINWY